MEMAFFLYSLIFPSILFYFCSVFWYFTKATKIMNAIKISAQVEQNNVLVLRNLPFEKGKKLKISIEEEEEEFNADEWKDKPNSAFRGALPNLNLAEWEQHIKDIRNEWGE